MRIAIVGGGIAGLTLAAALDLSRCEVTLHEAQPERAGIGSALGLWPSALRALDRIGAGDSLRRLGAGVSSGALRRADGRPIVRASAVGPLRGPLMLPRADLLGALEHAVPSSVRWEHAAVAAPEDLDADLVIGADGVRSVVRGVVHPAAAQRVVTPWVALRGILPRPPDVGTEGEYWGRSRLFGIVPMGSSGTCWFTSHPSALGPEPLDVAVVLAEAREVFAGDAPAIHQTLAAASADTLATRLWVTPPMPRYARGRYVVIGDAAHGMLPNLGRGACEAILDAVSLARTLDRGGRLSARQARRVPATQAARVASAGLMRLATSGLTGDGSSGGAPAGRVTP
ncbi:MAG: FAD-dependent monooxygenase [Micrococcales bacterium]|nr:FAD-dependent monooxygenase [Micrococcales bacterium]